jgi:hypothetical protein
MSTIFRKELRYILKWTPLGMIVIGLLYWQQVPRNLYECNDVSMSLTGIPLVGTSLFALTLGLLQSLFDLRTDARTFLLHRPIAASDIYRGKLMAGFVAHMLACGIPLLFVAVYLKTVGPEKLPVTWSDVVLPALGSLTSFFFHPAALWMACRDARWFGSRCLPLVLPCVAITATMLMSETSLSNATIMFPVVCVLIVGAGILSGAKHAFTKQTCLPPVGAHEIGSWPIHAGLTTASIVACFVFGITVLGYISQFQQAEPTTQRRLAMALDGQLWELERPATSQWQWGSREPYRVGRNLTGESSTASEFTNLDESLQEHPIVMLPPPNRPSRKGLMQGFEFLSSSASDDNGGAVSIYGRHGRLYVYGQFTGRQGTITPQGVFAPTEIPQGEFNAPNFLDYYTGTRFAYTAVGGHRLIADSSGIYQLDVDAGNLRKLADVPTDSMTITLPTDAVSSSYLWIRNDEGVHRYTVQPVAKEQKLPSVDSELVKATHQYPLANIAITPAGSWSMSSIERPKSTTLYAVSISDERIAFITDRSDRKRDIRFGNVGSSVQSATRLPDREQPTVRVTLDSFVMPPGLIAGIAFVVSFMEPEQWGPLPASAESWSLVALYAAIAAIGTFLLIRSRIRSIRSQLLWALFGTVAGIGTWLAVVAVYPRAVLERCTDCERQRRIDRGRCEYCGAEWELPDNQGITLIGPRQNDLTPQQVSI